MPRGVKTCTGCGYQTGPRAFRCPSCDKSFDIQRGITKRQKKRKGEKVDWTKLEEGECIRVVSGSGPYWEPEEGERIPLGHKGYFRVKDVKDDGIVVRGMTNKNSGYCFIYMGEKKVGVTGSIQRPHKIRKVKEAVVHNRIDRVRKRGK